MTRLLLPIPGREHIIAVERRADEQAPIFAETWHTDWSFQPTPPIGTCLFGIEIPPLRRRHAVRKPATGLALDAPAASTSAH
jgi:alpha-ketoglutarate-dependent taurine dioxygenase